MTQYDILIVGGGFAGMYSAWRLARDGRRVALVEASDHLGGTMWSWDWNGYLVDPGTHNFDLRSQIGAAFYEDILGPNLGETDRNVYCSTTGQTITQGFEMPDFSIDDPDLCQSALHQLAAIKGASARGAPDQLTAWMRATYGNRLGEALSECAEKVIGAPLIDLAAEARGPLGMLSRPKIGSDAEMIALKERDPFYDARLGVTLQSADRRFAGRNTRRRIGYPKTGALRGFCIAATKRLQALGVDVLTGHRVTQMTLAADAISIETSQGALSADRLFWTLPDYGLLQLIGSDVDAKASAQPVGSAFFAYEVDDAAVAEIDYLHDFSTKRRAYRYNRAGHYSGQIKDDGRTFVMAEVPSHPSRVEGHLNGDVASEIWHDMQSLGYVTLGTLLGDHAYWGYPVAYTLPKVGWQEAMNAAAAEIRNASPRLSTIQFGHRGRETFMRFYEDQLQHELRT